MNRILLSVFSVMLCFTLGYTLNCYKCDLGVFNVCRTTNVTCSANQQCFSGEGKAAGVLSVKTKGCLDVADCNKTSNVNFPSISNTTVYVMNKTCCITDMCNTAAPLANTHTLTIGSLAALLLTMVLM